MTEKYNKAAENGERRIPANDTQPGKVLSRDFGQDLHRWARAEEGADALLGVEMLATRGRRLRYVMGVSAADGQQLRAVHHELVAQQPDAFSKLADTLLRDEVLRPCCGGDTDIEQLRYSLRGFFEVLFEGRLVSDDDIGHRVDFLLRHRLLGLRFHWYLTVYDAWLTWLAQAALKGVDSSALRSAQRIQLFDMGLILMTYVVASKGKSGQSSDVDYASPSRRRKDFISRVDTLLRGRQLEGVTTVVVGIENLHQINTVMGHQVGDLVMQQAASRLVSSMRETDFLQRIGVTELGLALPGVVDEPLALLASHKFLKALTEPMQMAGRELYLKPALGIALGKTGAEGGAGLFQNAELSMREAARSHERVVFFTSELKERSRLLYSLEGELRQAINEGELRLVFQPQIDLQSGRCIGAESLLRWESRQHGHISPERFIPIAEQSGLIHALTAWVVQNSLREFSMAWGQQEGLTVSINISAVNLLEPDLPELIQRALRTWDVAPSQVIIEITESAVMENPEIALNHLNQLSDLGVALSIDDFGTGYSSLAYLKRLPVSELKIDRSFVMNMLQDRSDEQIVRTIINLGENFGKKVLAEGVEDESTRGRLRELGCARAQGYHFARPMPADEFAMFLRKFAR